MQDRILHRRWCIYIDILGFSNVWESENEKVLHSLRELVRAIYRIGKNVYPNNGERLFAHQCGDGFAILSDFGEASLNRPITIAIALMRHVASTGMFAAATVAEGELADIRGCYPEEVTADSRDDGAVILGDGLMTLFSVMGTAFIRSYRLQSQAPSGPFLMVSECNKERIPADLRVRATKSCNDVGVVSIDWVNAETQILTTVQNKADLYIHTQEALVQKIRDYYEQNESIQEKWADNLSKLLGIDI